ncbi:unnamed protein product [Strongylus vulgaris]|uniref:Uncharacterized protein n=1 Tax=Strongylus vulgaris TaxID=40348 RepID=A0A3P7IRR4_STRVU|nr:unnamed protein product [Strongylus vulgaris]
MRYRNRVEAVVGKSYTKRLRHKFSRGSLAKRSFRYLVKPKNMSEDGYDSFDDDVVMTNPSSLECPDNSDTSLPATPPPGMDELVVFVSSIIICRIHS